MLRQGSPWRREAQGSRRGGPLPQIHARRDRKARRQSRHLVAQRRWSDAPRRLAGTDGDRRRDFGEAARRNDGDGSAEGGVGGGMRGGEERRGDGELPEGWRWDTLGDVIRGFE